MNDFESRLRGGHPNSLGKTIEIVDEVSKDHSLFEQLFNCFFSNDEVVRLRTSNAMKRLCKSEEQLLVPYIDRFLDEIAAIDQASVQWTLAQLFEMLAQYLSAKQLKAAIKILQRNLETNNDWIVLNTTMNTLGNWSTNDADLRRWLIPRLERFLTDKRKSVSGRSKKILAQIG